MPDPAPFLAAIRAAPADDAPRLVYADWLDEHEQPERAEFIRVQCERARRDAPDLRAREAELLERHYGVFAGPLAAPGLRFRFGRGFVTGFGHSGVFVFADPYLNATRTVLRFYPGGRLIDASVQSYGEPAFSPTALDSLARLDPRWCPDRIVGSYRVDGVESPGRLRITSFWPDLDGGLVGSLEQSSYQFNPTGTFSRKFDHVPMNHFDSFSDPPADAAPPA